MYGEEFRFAMPPVTKTRSSGGKRSHQDSFRLTLAGTDGIGEVVTREIGSHDVTLVPMNPQNGTSDQFRKRSSSHFNFRIL